jgi:hypothetical protein
MELGELYLPLLKQQIKYFIGLSDIKADFSSSFLPKGQVLGNWVKTLHSRNVGFAEFVN